MLFVMEIPVPCCEYWPKVGARNLIEIICWCFLLHGKGFFNICLLWRMVRLTELLNEIQKISCLAATKKAIFDH